jgi:hypothetical protein
VFNQESLQRHLRSFIGYYNDASYYPTFLCG